VDVFDIKKVTCVWIAFADVKKAYDNVNLEILDTLMRTKCRDPLVLSEWEDEYFDMLALNMDVNDYVIKRTKGLPQGSELAPVLFNFYTTSIVENLRLEEGVDFAIFADNWVYVSDDYNKLVQAISTTNLLLKTYDLEFNFDELEIISCQDGGFDVFEPECDQPKCPKFLGVKWFNYNKKIWFDYRELTFKMPEWMIKPGYEMIKLAKRFLIPKFRYYWTYLKAVSRSQANEYLLWFKKVLRKWMQHHLIYQNISDEFLNEVMFPQKGFYVTLADQFARDNTIETRNLNDHQVKLLWRLKEIAYAVAIENRKIGIYQASNLLFNDLDIQFTLSQNEKVKGKPLKRAKMVVDILYKSIMGENRISTAVFRDQMAFAKKTLRKRKFTVF